MPPVVVGIMWKLFFQPQAGVLNETLRRRRSRPEAPS
jgi:ABC-type sugar transport system permease subunit